MKKLRLNCVLRHAKANHILKTILAIYFLTTIIKYVPTATESVMFEECLSLEIKSIDFLVLGKLQFYSF